MSRYRVEETGETITGWPLYNHLAHQRWDIDRDRWT